MDYSHRLNISYYETISVLNEQHRIYLVRHRENGKICIKKELTVYNTAIYETLRDHKLKGIAHIIDFYEENNCLIVLEEYVSGQSLSELITTHTLTHDQMLHYCISLCNILHTLHSFQQPIIHRDIKPSNIIITEQDDPVLLDFNAAKEYKEMQASDTVLLGTQGYAAPEQYGFGASTPQTDIYSLGILLREMNHSLAEPDLRLTPIINKCLEMNPRDRYSSATALAYALSAIVEPSAQSATPTESRHPFTPPGFRTHSLWKMVTATVSYLSMMILCINLVVKNEDGSTTRAPWSERIATYLIFLTIVCFVCNYRDIHKYCPFHDYKTPIIRRCGIGLMCFLIIMLILIIDLIIESLLQTL